MSLPTGAKGSSLPMRQPDRVGWDPTRGATRWAVWKCINQAQIDTLAAQAAGLLLPYNLVSTGTTHTIEVEIVGGSVNPALQAQPLDRWEMPGNEIQKTIWEHNKLIGVDPEAVALAQKWLADGKTYSQCAVDNDAVWAGLSSTEDDDLAAAFELAQRQSTHFPIGQYVLRHLSNVGAGWAANITDLNVEKIYTAQQLLAEVCDPVLWLYPLPPRLQLKIQTLRAPTARTGYLWGWRKLPSTEATAAGGRIELSTEYWLEQWSTWIYDVVT